MTSGACDGIKSMADSGLGPADQKRDEIPDGNHNDVEKRKNPCPIFLSTSSSETFSSLSGSGGSDGRGGTAFVVSVTVNCNYRVMLTSYPGLPRPDFPRFYLAAVWEVTDKIWVWKAWV